MLLRYKKILKENYSDPEMGNYRWMMQFVILIALFTFIGFVRNVFRFTSSETLFNLASMGVVICVLVFISWLLIKSLNQPGFFTGIFSHLQPVNRLLDKEENSTSEFDEQAIKKLRTHMESREPYLDASLSMNDLSNQLGMKVRDLSILINHKLDQHFFDFVNQYRISKAMELLRDPQNTKMTVLEILYEVGFNSKSSFNTIFKKQTGQTPTQYRRTNAG
jgi:AraC-like DNA-binding protein